MSTVFDVSRIGSKRELLGTVIRFRVLRRRKISNKLSDNIYDFTLSMRDLITVSESIMRR